MKKIFMGTHMEADQLREFGILAAKAGLSKSALLKQLALKSIADASKPTPRKRKAIPA